LIEIIAFDADDTLWHSETAYHEAALKLGKLLSDHYGLDDIEGEIYKTEKNNLPHFGYGMKGFTISMIDASIRLTGGRIEGDHISQIIDIGREMLDSSLELIDGAEETVAGLAAKFPLMLITKGDYPEQQRKINLSGLAGYFRHIDIVAEKTPASYAALLERYRIDRSEFLMVGNSLRSDILPVVSLGGTAVHIPYHIIWEHETILEEPISEEQYYRLETLYQLPSLIKDINNTPDQ
jgi:putative hydrolase of the HAD superfamily